MIKRLHEPVQSSREQAWRYVTAGIVGVGLEIRVDALKDGRQQSRGAGFRVYTTATAATHALARTLLIH